LYKRSHAAHYFIRNYFYVMVISLKQLSFPRLQNIINGFAASKRMSTSKNILIIDDDHIFIYLTRKVLQTVGNVNEIDVLYSAEEALQFLQYRNMNKLLPDIILLDLNMPGMTGWDFLHQYQSLIRNFHKLPLLYVVSSSIAENDKERALQLKGVNGYIAKPVTADNLRNILL